MTSPSARPEASSTPARRLSILAPSVWSARSSSGGPLVTTVSMCRSASSVSVSRAAMRVDISWRGPSATNPSVRVSVSATGGPAGFLMPVQAAWSVATVSMHAPNFHVASSFARLSAVATGAERQTPESRIVCACDSLLLVCMWSADDVCRVSRREINVFALRALGRKHRNRVRSLGGFLRSCK